MIDSDEVDLRANENVVLERYAASVHEFAAMVNKDALTDANVLAEVRVEGWQHPE